MMILFHGSSENFSELKNEYVFFSTDESFAKDYGDVKTFKVKSTKVFDSCNKENVLELLGYVGEIIDSYDDAVYKDYDTYKNSSLFGSDTWELFERYLKQIKNLGYDTVIIYEGGYKNYVTLKGNFEMTN